MPTQASTGLIGRVPRVLATAGFRLIVATFAMFVAIEAFRDGGLRSILLAPGSDPASPENQAVVDQFNLDGNVVERYGGWLINAVQGKFGTSHLSDVEVSDLLWQRLPITLQLMIIATVLALLIGVPVGVAAARWSGRLGGGAMSAVVGLFRAVPIYVTVWLLVWLILRVEWRPPNEWVSIRDSLSGYVQVLLVPVTALAIGEIAVVAATVRAEVRHTLSEVADEDADLNVSPRFFDLVRGALGPTSSGLYIALARNVGNLLSAVVLAEIFAGLDGLGSELLASVVSVDLPVVLGIATSGVLIYVAINALVELVAHRADSAPAEGKGLLPPAAVAR